VKTICSSVDSYVDGYRRLEGFNRILGVNMIFWDKYFKLKLFIDICEELNLFRICVFLVHFPKVRSINAFWSFFKYYLNVNFQIYFDRYFSKCFFCDISNTFWSLISIFWNLLKMLFSWSRVTTFVFFDLQIILRNLIKMN